MTSLLAFAYILSGTVMVLAWVVAHREPAHRLIAVLFTAALGSDLARRALRVLVLTPARARGGGEPFTGIARVACDLDNALFLSWPASLVAVSLWIFARRRPWPALAAWGAAVIALGLLYPATRGVLLQRCYLGADLAAVAVGIGSIAIWIRRRAWPELRHRSVMLVLAAECATLIGPWRVGPFARWDLAQVMYAALYAVLVVLHGGAAWRRPSHSR